MRDGVVGEQRNKEHDKRQYAQTASKFHRAHGHLTTFELTAFIDATQPKVNVTNQYIQRGPQLLIFFRMCSDMPLNFHPAATGVRLVFTSVGAG